MTNFKWSVISMSVTPEVGNMREVVFSVGVRCEGVSEEGSSHFDIHCGFELNPDGDFIPYSQLAEQQILEWAWGSGVDKESIEGSVQKAIETIGAAEESGPVFPWAK